MPDVHRKTREDSKLKRLLSGILICAGMAGAVLLGGCVQTPQKPDIREGAAISPITAVFFPDDCTDFTGARLPTVQELRVSEENTAYTAVDGVIFTKDLETLVAFPAGRDGTYAVPDGTKKIAAGAFANCRIEEVYIPDSVTAIGNRAFDGCMALKEISFPTVFEADGNILPHCAALPEYIIDGLRVHHRGEPDEIKDTLGDILPEMCPYRSRTCAKNGQGNLSRTITLYRLQKNHLDLSTGSIAEIVYTTQTAEYLMNGGDIVIPEGYKSWTVNDLQYARFPITSVTFPNNVGVGNMILFMSDFGIEDYPFSMYDYYVKEDNPRFVSVDGVIFTADLKSLVAFPIGRTGHYDIPDGTEIVEYGAFLDTHLESVYVPDSVRLVDDLGLNSLHLKSLSLPAHAADPSSLFFGYAAIAGLNTGSVPDDLVITYRTAASETSLR